MSRPATGRPDPMRIRNEPPAQERPSISFPEIHILSAGYKRWIFRSTLAISIPLAVGAQFDAALGRDAAADWNARIAHATEINPLGQVDETAANWASGVGMDTEPLTEIARVRGITISIVPIHAGTAQPLYNDAEHHCIVAIRPALAVMPDQAGNCDAAAFPIAHDAAIQCADRLWGGSIVSESQRRFSLARDAALCGVIAERSAASRSERLTAAQAADAGQRHLLAPEQWAPTGWLPLSQRLGLLGAAERLQRSTFADVHSALSLLSQRNIDPSAIETMRAFTNIGWHAAANGDSAQFTAPVIQRVIEMLESGELDRITVEMKGRPLSELASGELVELTQTLFHDYGVGYTNMDLLFVSKELSSPERAKGALRFPAIAERVQAAEHELATAGYVSPYSKQRLRSADTSAALSF